MTAVGDTVWCSVDRYARDAKPEDFFEALTITGETRVSWIAKWSWRELKFPKKKPASEWHKDPDTRLASAGRGRSTRIFLTRRAVDDEVWLVRNRDGLRQHVEQTLRGADVARLRALAVATGYESPEAV